MSYKELLRDQILAPLGVTMTGITLHAAAGDDAALRPAHDDRSALMPRWDFGALAASGAMFRAPPTYLRPHLRARRPTASGRPDAKLSITGGRATGRMHRTDAIGRLIRCGPLHAAALSPCATHGLSRCLRQTIQGAGLTAELPVGKRLGKDFPAARSYAAYGLDLEGWRGCGN
jgi:CubicO group peptidase (beta-lactamase class C family)